MKYGIVYRKTSKNIGDDIQAYAASQWLPSVDYMIDLEALDSFEAEDDEPVAAIMSAWYMWAKWHWPPTKSLYPLWIGLHYNDQLRDRKRGMPAKFEYIADGPGKEYLKKYEPIGCRDPYTQGELDKLGIKNYFSGCVTLTMQRRDLPKPKKEYVVLVDVGPKVEKAVRKQLKGTGIDVKVVASTRKKRMPNLTWEQRKAHVEKMLETYQNAKCAITFRLHCSLPCLALGTPVLLCRSIFNSIRFQPYMDWMHKATPDQVINGEFRDFMLNPPENPDDYKPVRENLIKLCKDFVEKAKKETRKASEIYETQYSEIDVLRWQTETMKKTLDNYLEECRYDLKERLELEKKVKRLEAVADSDKQQFDEVLKENDEMKKIVNCSSVQFVLKIRAFYSNIVYKLRGENKREEVKKY